MRLKILVAALVCACAKSPPEPPVDSVVAAPTVSGALEIDPTVRRGVLANGVRWYVETNRVPEHKAVLRLGVGAGSVLEDDDQLGVAHFLEHMAFNGTASFPSNELVAYLESVGTRFGPHLNAHTSFEETVYKLTVPSDDAEVFDRGLQILHEWACCLTLDPAEIEKERGVVREEWRLRQGLPARMTERSMALRFAGSVYPDRMPIGTDASLRSFDPAVVGRFYRDWYRPDLLTVVVVGDVDPDAVEARIAALFGDLQPPADPRRRVDPDIPDHDEALYDVLADPEITKTSGWMAAQLDLPEASTWDELVHDHVVTLAVMGLNERLAELVRDPAGPFLRLAVGEQRLTPREGVQQVTFTAKEGRALEAFRAALVEVERFRRYGLTAGELERARKARLAWFDKLVREAEDSDSTGHADEIVRHALRGEPMMGTVPEAEAGKRIVGAVALEDVNTFAAGFLPERSRSTFVTLPATEGIEPPTPDALRAVAAEVPGVALDPPADRQTVDALVEPPAPGSVVLRDHRYTGDLGFTGLTLANGTQVWWRRTDFTPGEIEIRARRRGGAAAVSDADRTFAVMRMTDRARYESGLGAHDRAAVAGYLKGRSLSFRVGMGDFETSLGGTTATVDLPVALELAYAFQVEPAFTPEGIAFTRELWRDSIVNAANNPDRRFSDAWTLLLWPDDPRSPPLVPDDVERLTPDRAAVLYDGAMGSPEEWTWVFVGDLPADFEDQVALWLGGIPRDVPGHAWVDRGFHRAPGVRRQVVQGGTADRARYRTELYGRLGDEPDDPAWRANFSAFGDILAVRLRERLREDLGGVYGVSAFASTWDDPYRGWRVRVEFQCDPERVDELEAAMEAVFAEMVADGVDEAHVAAEVAKNRESWEDGQRRNTFWIGSFADNLEHGRDPRVTLRWPSIDASLTPERVQALAKVHLTAPDRATLVMTPRP